MSSDGRPVRAKLANRVAATRGTSDPSALRQLNWTLGVKPQDVRFPTNIAEVAFSQNYFAALTTDRIRIFVNRRVPGELANCKRKAIEFDVEHRPSRIVSFDCRDVLCVVFDTKVEFYSLVNLEKVGVYQSSSEEFVSQVAAFNSRAPLGCLWCRQDKRKRRTTARHSTFTYWTAEVVVPRQAPLRRVGRRGDKFGEFRWTSDSTVLLATRPEGRRIDESRRLVFCSFEIVRQKTLGRCQVAASEAEYKVAPAGALLLLILANRYQLHDSRSLRLLHRLSRPFARNPLAHAVTDTFDVVRLNPGGKSVEFFANFHLLRRLQPTQTVEVGEFFADGDNEIDKDEGVERRICPIGDFGVLCVTERSRGESGEKTTSGTERADVMLIDKMGRILLTCRWPRSSVHYSAGDTLVQLQHLCPKPFSAAHARIFDFDEKRLKASVWLSCKAAASNRTGDA